MRNQKLDRHNTRSFLLCFKRSKFDLLFSDWSLNIETGRVSDGNHFHFLNFLSIFHIKDEWELLLSFIATFPTIVKDTVPTLAATSQSFVIHTNKVCLFNQKPVLTRLVLNLRGSTLSSEAKPFVLVFPYILKPIFNNYNKRIRTLLSFLIPR